MLVVRKRVLAEVVRHVLAEMLVSAAAKPVLPVRRHVVELGLSQRAPVARRNAGKTVVYNIIRYRKGKGLWMRT